MTSIAQTPIKALQLAASHQDQAPGQAPWSLTGWRSSPMLGALALGLLFRILYSLLRTKSGASGEAANVAISLATNGGFANAFGAGEGPTAHFTPSMTLVAGAVYRLFGVHTRLSEFLLSTLALALVVGSYRLAFTLFGRLGLSFQWRCRALGFLLLVPVYLAQEAVDFRIWEGALAVFLGLMLLLALTAAPAREGDHRVPLTVPALAALLFFVNGPLGLAGYVAVAWRYRRLSPGPMARTALVSAAALAALVVPWTIRNVEVMHHPIKLRDNLGLELALANYDGALDKQASYLHFKQRLFAIHPAVSRLAYDRMVGSGGEVAYAAMMGREARGWMIAHPVEAIRLSLRHLRQYYFPQAWQFASHKSMLVPVLRAVVASLVALLGLAAALRCLVRGSESQRLVAIMTIVPGLPYALFQPIPRYSWLTWIPLVYFAAMAVEALVKARRGRIDTRALAFA